MPEQHYFGGNIVQENVLFPENLVFQIVGWLRSWEHSMLRSSWAGPQ